MTEHPNAGPEWPYLVALDEIHDAAEHLEALAHIVDEAADKTGGPSTPEERRFYQLLDALTEQCRKLYAMANAAMEHVSVEMERRRSAEGVAIKPAE